VEILYRFVVGINAVEDCYVNGDLLPINRARLDRFIVPRFADAGLANHAEALLAYGINVGGLHDRDDDACPAIASRRKVTAYGIEDDGCLVGLQYQKPLADHAEYEAKDQPDDCQERAAAHGTPLRRCDNREADTPNKKRETGERQEICKGADTH
jgi:hypothetical protein